MRSEFVEYYSNNKCKYRISEKILFKLKLFFARRKFKRIKLGSEEWHRVQNKVSQLSSTNYDSLIRTAFYEITLAQRCKGKFYCLPNVCINFPNRVKLGYNVFLNRNVNIVAREEIVIGNNVLIGPNTVINSGSHIYTDPKKLIRDQGHKKKSIIIDDDVFIGGNVFILPGVHIGQGAIVGAGAVVSKDVKPYTVVAGVPATVIGRRE